MTFELLNKFIQNTMIAFVKRINFSPFSSTSFMKASTKLNIPTLSSHQRIIREREETTSNDFLHSNTRKGRIIKSDDQFIQCNAYKDRVGLIVRNIKLRAVKNQTSKGKIGKFSALIAVGDGKGAIGLSMSKNISLPVAVQRAVRLATRNMQKFPIFENRTLFHDDYVKFKATKIQVKPAAPNTGRRCHPTINEICRCIGLRDICASVKGSRNPINVAYAFLRILGRQQTPEEVSRVSGMKIVDVLKIYQEGCDSLSATLQKERFSNTSLKENLRNK